MSSLDDYLIALPFVDGHPSQLKTTFLEVACGCRMNYATRVSQFETEAGAVDPASDRAISESDAVCPHCSGLMREKAKTIAMYVSGGVAIRTVRPPHRAGFVWAGVDLGAPDGDKTVEVEMLGGKIVK